MYNIIYKAHVRLDNNGIVEQFLGRCGVSSVWERRLLRARQVLFASASICNWAFWMESLKQAVLLAKPTQARRLLVIREEKIFVRLAGEQKSVLAD
jgi:hypothetical protein